MISSIDGTSSISASNSTKFTRESGSTHLGRQTRLMVGHQQKTRQNSVKLEKETSSTSWTLRALMGKNKPIFSSVSDRKMEDLRLTGTSNFLSMSTSTT